MKAFNLKSYLTKGGAGNSDVLIEIDGELFEPKLVKTAGDKKIILAVKFEEEVEEVKEEEVVEAPVSEPETEPETEEETEEENTEGGSAPEGEDAAPAAE